MAVPLTEWNRPMLQKELADAALVTDIAKKTKTKQNGQNQAQEWKEFKKSNPKANLSQNDQQDAWFDSRNKCFVLPAPSGFREELMLSMVLFVWGARVYGYWSSVGGVTSTFVGRREPIVLWPLYGSRGILVMSAFLTSRRVSTDAFVIFDGL
ncbi:hypothetical protein Tco_0997064 [Tanacetum coccineum]